MAGAIDPPVCFECGAPADHDHHVVPRSLGGTKTVPLCERCHGVVHERGGMVGHRALTSMAMQDMRVRGAYTGGRCRYGYRVGVDGVLVPIESEQAVIATTRRMRAQGITLRSIVEALDEIGVRGRTGRPLALAQVARMVAAR